MKTKTKLKLKKQVLFKGIALFLVLFSILIFIRFIEFELLPFKFLVGIFVLLIFIDALLYYLLSRKNYKMRILGSFLSFVFFLSFGCILYYQEATFHFLKEISFLNIQTETYEVIVPRNSSLDAIETLCYVNDRKGILKAVSELQKKKNYQEKTFEDSSELISALLDQKIDAIVMEKEEANVYYEMSLEFEENTKVFQTIDVEVQNETISKNFQITEKPFNVYLTGIDTYGNISKVSRSDVNIVVTVQPQTHQILLTSIPRDYYVQISGTTGLKDKLTHAGLKGVDVSMKTIENILDTEIPYYIKINFTSLVDIIDTIGGVDVNNPFEFTANYQEEDGSFIYYKFYQGNIHLDGKKALAYVRERYDLREGDVARARHQQQVIKAMSDKLMSPTILSKYPQLLKSIEGGFVTNLSLTSIKDFIEMQLDENPSWTIDTMVLTGIDSSEKTAAFPDAYSSVMIPDEKVVKEAIQKIENLMKEN